MRLLVTGGCGFIGSNFIRLALQELPSAFVCNYDLLTYAGNLANVQFAHEEYPDRYAFVQGDIADPRAVKEVLTRYKITHIVNFAAESHVDRSIHDPMPFITTNVVGTQNLLTVARELNIERFVHVSTDEVYGSLGATGVFTEETPLAPNSPYSASKASSDLLCRAWFETYGFPVIITRCSNNYGPYQFPEKLIPLMFMRAQKNEPLPVYGDGSNVRDWIYVEDHCRGVLLALLKGKDGKVYNFGGNAERTNLEVVKHILDFCGKPESLISYVTDRPGHDKRYAMDFSLATKELGFSPRYSFAEGLHATLQWYTMHTHWIDGVISGAYKNFMQEWYGGRL